MMRRVLAAYAVLAIVTVFYPVLFGELPVPTDCALRLLPGATPPAASSGGNDERWDLPTQYIPWTRAVSDAYRGGRLPLRFAANGCGNPLWANPQAQVLTPTTWVTWPLPEAWALAVAAALRLWLAAAGTFLWLRRRRLSEPAAAAGGLAYGFSLAFTTWLHYPLTYPQALLPWLLLALERLAEDERGGFVAATSAMVALFLGGYPEGELLAGAGACVFAVALPGRTKHRPRRFAAVAVSALLALGLTAIVWLPQLHAVLGSERSAHVARATALTAPVAPPLTWALLRPPPDLDLLRYWVVPEARGNPRDGDKFGPYSFAGRTSGHAGILVLAFALAAFAWRRAPSAVSLARIALVLLVLYVLAFPPLRWLTDAVPGVRFVMHRVTTGRLQFLAVFLMAMLAAFQLDRLRGGGGRAAAVVACAVLLLAVVVVFLQFLQDPAHPTLNAWRAVRFVLPALLLAAMLALLSGPPSPKRAGALTVLFLAGTGLELLRIGARFNPGTRPADYFPVTSVVRDLRTAAAGGRFAANTGALSGMAYLYGLEDVGMQDPMTPARYLDALAAGTGYDAPAHPLGNVRRIDAPMLDFLNARARLDGETVRQMAAATAPAAILPERLIGCADEAELLRRLATEPDLVHAGLLVGRDETFQGRAEIVSLERPRPELLRIRVRSDAARVLVLPESDDGGWSADAEGQPVTTLLVNGAFLGIRIPAGEARLVCRYLPPGFRRGALISAVTMIVAMAAAAKAALARRRA
jgi:hypothetical protein